MHKFNNDLFNELNDIVILGIICCVSIVLSVLESTVMINFVLPGLKLGLSNIIIILLIRRYSLKKLISIQVIKVVVMTFILGLFSTFIFSIVACMMSLLITYMFSRFKFLNVCSLSVISAVVHNIFQVLVAVFYLNSFSILNYLPYIIVFGIIMGNITGYICLRLTSRFNKEINDFI